MSARSDRWIKAETPTKLEDDKVEVFSSYVRYVYTGDLDLPEDNMSSLFGLAVQVYVIADKLQDLKAGNFVIDKLLAMLKKHGQFPGPRSICMAFENTTADSTLRKLLSDCYVFESEPDSEEAFPNNPKKGLPTDFMIAGMKESQRVIHGVGSSKTLQESHGLVEAVDKRPRCRYHRHDEDHPRSRGD